MNACIENSEKWKEYWKKLEENVSRFPVKSYIRHMYISIITVDKHSASWTYTSTTLRNHGALYIYQQL